MLKQIVFAACIAPLLLSCSNKNNNSSFRDQAAQEKFEVQVSKPNTKDIPQGSQDMLESKEGSKLLAPLLLPGELKSMVERGRLDPFQPPSFKDSNINSQALKIYGFIKIQGKHHSLVKTSFGSGLICEGLQGSCNLKEEQKLLPKGWTVVSMNLKTGCILLKLPKNNEQLEQCML